jgi:hypothetical protein
MHTGSHGTALAHGSLIDKYGMTSTNEMDTPFSLDKQTKGNKQCLLTDLKKNIIKNLEIRYTRRFNSQM